MGKRKEKRAKLNWKSGVALASLFLFGVNIFAQAFAFGVFHFPPRIRCCTCPSAHSSRSFFSPPSLSPSPSPSQSASALRFFFVSFFFSFSFFERHFDVVPFQVQFGVGFIADTWLKCSRMPDECNCYTTDMAWHDWLIDGLTDWLQPSHCLMVLHWIAIRFSMKIMMDRLLRDVGQLLYYYTNCNTCCKIN